jgi:hypothetical protein
MSQGHLITERLSLALALCGSACLCKAKILPLHESPRSPGVESPSGNGGIKIQGTPQDINSQAEVLCEE